jgi:hypothetical protein
MRDLSGGAIIQRKRIDEFIRSTSELSVERAIESLNENGETFGVVSLAALSPTSLGRCYIKQVLADRRVTRVFQHLEEQPAHLAASAANDIFEDKLEIMVANWKQMALGGSNSADSFARLGPDHHAASVGLFFCSYFCSPNVFDEKLHKWDEQMNATVFDQIDGVQFLSNNRLIDPLFRINLLVISGSRNRASIDALNRELEVMSGKITGDSKPIFEITKLNLFTWDAETLDTDFTNVTRGVPASADSVLMQLPGFADANSGAYLQDEQVLSQLVKTISKWRQSGSR